MLQRQIIERDPWSGQISFPGGRSKRGETLLETAKREVMEEAGIDLDGCEIVGPMESVYPGNLSINVTPFVVIAPEDIVVKIDHTEIAEYFWAPLSYFSDKKNSAVYTFTRSERLIKVPSFVVSGKYVVWGMTLKIILNLLSEPTKIVCRMDQVLEDFAEKYYSSETVSTAAAGFFVFLSDFLAPGEPDKVVRLADIPVLLLQLAAEVHVANEDMASIFHRLPPSFSRLLSSCRKTCASYCFSL